MGGVDFADNMVANYKIGIRGKNGGGLFFSNYVDVSIVNAWKLWRVMHSTDSTSLLKFRRDFSVNYLRASKSGHVPISTGPPIDFRMLQAVIPDLQHSTFCKNSQIRNISVATNAISKLVFSAPLAKCLFIK